MGDTSIQSVVLHGIKKKEIFHGSSWRLGEGRQTPLSNPPLYLIINIINMVNPGRVSVHIPCVFSSSFHAKTSPVLVAVAKLAAIVSPSLDDL